MESHEHGGAGSAVTDGATGIPRADVQGSQPLKWGGHPVPRAESFIHVFIHLFHEHSLGLCLLSFRSILIFSFITLTDGSYLRFYRCRSLRKCIGLPELTQPIPEARY